MGNMSFAAGTELALDEIAKLKARIKELEAENEALEVSLERKDSELQLVNEVLYNRDQVILDTYERIIDGVYHELSRNYPADKDEHWDFYWDRIKEAIIEPIVDINEKKFKPLLKG